MQTGKNQEFSREEEDTASPPGGPRRRQGWWTLACVAAAVILAGAAQPRQQTQMPAATPGGSNPNPQVSNISGVNTQPKTPDEKTTQKNSDATSAEQNRQIAEDSAKLLKLATDLKAEVDKTNKDTLSLRVIRTADEIEHLAHSVRQKMKLTAGAD